jgi:hypothetical protein
MKWVRDVGGVWRSGIGIWKGVEKWNRDFGEVQGVEGQL